MTEHNIGEAFSAGLGLALGLGMAQYMFQAMKPTERIIKQVIVCLQCGSRNPIEYKFCGQCGQSLYPPPSIQCTKCGAIIPSNINFCRNCGSPLKEIKKTRKKRS